MTMTNTTKALNDAAVSEPFLAIATIAGSKAHRVTARTLLEDAVTEQFVRMGYLPAGAGWGEITKTVTLEAGTVLYYGTACGTARQAGGWKTYRNDYREADVVTCAKCAKAATR